MGLKLQAVENISATWLSLAVHAVVSFFLSPFILHRLGDDAFSLWVLVFSLTGYYGLLDLGLRTSIVCYVAKFAATGEEEQLARFLTTSLAFYVVVGVVTLLLTAAGFFYLPVLFHIPRNLLGITRMLSLLGGVGVALSFPLGVFAALLEGMQKFSWVQLSQIGITLLRGALIFIALRYDGRLLAVGVITVLTNLLSYLVLTWMALRAFTFHFSLGQVDSQAFRKLLRYSSFAFLILVAEKLRFHSDPIVIGAFLSSTAITYFSIGARLVEYSTYGVRSVAQIFTPMSSQFAATGDFARLRHALIAGNRACAIIIFPLTVILLVLGKSIIAAWVGARYLSSYSVLAVLTVPRAIYLAQSTSTRIFLGMGRHQMLALVLLLEGGVNVILSTLLVRRFGIVGVAVGTAIPLTCTSLFFLPRHICRQLHIPLAAFLRQTYLLPLGLCIPMAGVLVLLQHEFQAHSYGGLTLEIACGGAVYCAAFCLALFAVRPVGGSAWKALSQLSGYNENAQSGESSWALEMPLEPQRAALEQ
jgi:O-antigen/teichoic acid export membrane protein